MKEIDTVSLEVGKQFDTSVYMDDTYIVIGPNIPIAKDDIKRLKKWGIKKLYVHDNAVEIETKPKLSIDQKSPAIKGHNNNTEAIVKPKIVSNPAPRDDVSLQAAHQIETALGNDMNAIEAYKNIRGKRFRLNEIYNNVIHAIASIYANAKNPGPISINDIKSIIGKLVKECQTGSSALISFTQQEYTGEYLPIHVVNVCILSLVTGKALGYSINQLLQLGMAALLYDIGMTRIPRYITEKKESLTSDEYNRIKTHTLIGYQIIANENKLSNDIAQVALQHHEHVDGSGYPRKLTGDMISEFSKIVAIADAYQAMIKHRSFKNELISYEAMKSVISNSSGKYDPIMIRAFLSNMAIYPIGSLVQLNDDTIGIVVNANPNQPLRPVIKILFDKNGQRLPPLKNENLINLLTESKYFIKCPVDEKILNLTARDKY